MIMRAGKPEICKAGHSLETEAGGNVSVFKQNVFFLGKPQFLLLRPSSPD